MNPINHEKIINKELIGGRFFERMPIDERIEKLTQNIFEILEHIKLTAKPLDEISEPFVSTTLSKAPNTILRPMVSVKVNKSDRQVDWVIDYTDSEDNELAYCIKPMYLKEGGVREYWVLDINNEELVIYNFEKSGFIQQVVPVPRRIKIGIYNAVETNYSDIFKDLPPKKAKED